MTPKPASSDLEASNNDAAASPPGDSDGDGVEALETAKPSGESYDDSLEAILLQAGARPPEPAASKLLGSKTLMGFGIEGLNLASIRAAGDARSAATAEGGAAPQTDEGTHRTGTTQSEDKEVTSLLDEVAQALNVQATEYRDRARGRLPGMPSAAAPSGKPPGHVAFTSGRSEDAEFEDPDDNPVALTPAIISVVDEHDDAEPAVNLDAEDEAGKRLADDAADDAVVLAPSEPEGAGRAKDTKSGSRPVTVPPVPGLMLGTAPPTIGPPPGLAPRPPTPSGGLSPISGRVRLPTPAPGLPVPPLPSPGVGRMTLPLGIAIPSSSALSGTDLTATASPSPMALETSRRTNASGRVSTRRNARTTQLVVPLSSSSLPSVLTAHVKLATVSLAGLIAVTFAGGLFVGMLVWKGQGRGEHASGSAAVTPPPAAVPANANAPSTTNAAAAATAAGAATNVAAPAIPPPTEVVVTPLAPGSPSPETATTPKPVRRMAAAARPRRPAPAPTVADTAALFPKTVAGRPAARPATGAAAPASKPMATNAAAKPAPKSKTKTTWHDPFAD